jgi:hypothetical protein
MPVALTGGKDCVDFEKRIAERYAFNALTRRPVRTLPWF